MSSFEAAPDPRSPDADDDPSYSFIQYRPISPYREDENDTGIRKSKHFTSVRSSNSSQNSLLMLNRKDKKQRRLDKGLNDIFE